MTASAAVPDASTPQAQAAAPSVVRPNSLAARDIASVLHPYTNLKKHETVGPLVITRGEGVRVYDDDGKAYIEGLSGLWCLALGFGEERLVQAAADEMRKLGFYHTFGHKSHDKGIELAEALLKMLPAPPGEAQMARVFFANSGSEANDTAMKIAWYYWNAVGRPAKKKIISRTRAYHGVTIATASLTGLPYNHKGFDLPIAGILHADCPHYWRHSLPGESEEAFATRLADNLEALIQREGPETIAAFIGEPVMGAGGVIVPPATYWEKIQAVLRRHDILLIADEVICGFGRTGRPFGADTYGIRPDMVSVAKALSAAYLPISALGIGTRVYEAIRDYSDRIGMFGHGYTYSAHPVAAATALEALKIYAERDLFARAAALAPQLQDGLRRFAGHPLVGDVRGVGLIGAIELQADPQAKRPFDPKHAIGPWLVNRAQERGLILRALAGDTVAFCPPLVISAADIDAILAIFGAALDDTLTHVRTAKLAVAS